MVTKTDSGVIQIGEITRKWAEHHGIPTRYFPVIPSTNETAKSKAFVTPDLDSGLSLYITDHQTEGRGRGENHWVDASPGSSLLCSWSFALPFNPQPTTSPLVGLALYRALISTWPFLDWSLKAPNDIFLREKKVAGILLETVSQGEKTRLIVGLGINIFAYPSEIDSASCISSALPGSAPLLGQDWLCFMDRVYFEITDVTSRCDSLLTPTDCLAIQYALNKNTLMEEVCTEVSPDGSLILGKNTVHWSKL